MSEKYAVERWCPFATTVVQALTPNRLSRDGAEMVVGYVGANRGPGAAGHTRCLASGCMAWCRDAAAGPDHGSCGLTHSRT